MLDPAAQPYILAHTETSIRLVGPFRDLLDRFDFMARQPRPNGERWDPVMLPPDMAADCLVVAPEMVAAAAMAGRAATTEAVE